MRVQVPILCKSIFELEIHAFLTIKTFLPMAHAVKWIAPPVSISFTSDFDHMTTVSRNYIDCPWGKHSTSVIATDEITFQCGYLFDINAICHTKLECKYSVCIATCIAMPSYLCNCAGWFPVVSVCRAWTTWGAAEVDTCCWVSSRGPIIIVALHRLGS